MPIIVKPLIDINTPTSGNPIDHRSDGFDPLIPYQMIPLGSTREMAVRTGDFKAEMVLGTPDISSMSNFRILSQTSPSLFPLPGTGVAVGRIALPERSVIQFTLAGRAAGITVLEGRDRPGLGAPLLKADFNLRISVKKSDIRKVAVCYVFDRVNKDTGARAGFAGHLAEIHKVFHDQANITIFNVDGQSASTLDARTITLDGTSGKVFNLLDFKLIGRVIDGFNGKFPGVFGQVNAVVMSISVPLRIKTRPKDRILGISIRFQRKATGEKFNLLLVGPQALRARPKSGGARPTPTHLLRNTLAHELGHCFGLKHDPAEVNDLPPELIGKDVNPEFFKPIFHNLMFPIQLIVSNRLNGAQVERLHLNRPEFRQVDF